MTSKDLLLSPNLEFSQVADLLSPYGFREIKRADANLQLIAEDPRSRMLLAEIIDDLLHSLSRSPDPDQALNYLERFARATYNKNQLFSHLKESPYTLWLLAKLFGSSPFLSEILIRNPTYLYWISNQNTLERSKPKAVLAGEFATALRTIQAHERKLEILCLLKRKELLRIGVRDLLGKSTVQQTTKSLSDLAEVIIQAIYDICSHSLQQRYGPPMAGVSGKKARPVPFTILGMGKLGGGELNFSSDVDLIYLYESEGGMTTGNPSTGGNGQIPNAEYFKKLARDITTALSGLTDEGYLYRVDLRLRPEGRSGEVAYPFETYLEYYRTRGETWERLALSKAWPAGGDIALGKRFLKKAAEFIYGCTFSPKQLEEVKRVKERIDAKMRRQGELDLNVKLGSGGIREIEFIVQSIQTFFGDLLPQIRERNTLRALQKLHKERILSRQDYLQLSDAYHYLRNVEHSLQMVHEFQTHRLPKNPCELRMCAIRLDYRDQHGASAADRFLNDFRRRTAHVNRIFRELFHAPETSPILQSARKRAAQASPKRSMKN